MASTSSKLKVAELDFDVINFNVKNVYDFDRFSDLSLKLKIEEGNYNFSNSNIIWKDNVKILFSESE